MAAGPQGAQTDYASVIFGTDQTRGGAAHINQLQGLIDELSRLAAPATASSLRLTQAYLKLPGTDGEPPNVVRHQAHQLRKVIWRIRMFTAFCFVLSILSLVHASKGRKALEQLEQQQATLTVFDDRLAFAATQQLSATQQPSFRLRDLCEQLGPQAQGPGGETGSAYQGLMQTCERRDQVLRERNVTRVTLANWNCTSSFILGRSDRYFNCPDQSALLLLLDQSMRLGDSGFPIDKSITPERERRIQWSVSPVRTANYLTILNGFLLPMLVGTLGGCTYVLRRIDTKVREGTLDASDRPHSVFRIMLAAIIGGLLGVVWSSESNIQIGEMSFSIIAIAFFVGFSLEIVFSVIDAMVSSVSGRLSSTPTGSTTTANILLMQGLSSSKLPSSAAPVRPPTGETVPVKVQAQGKE
jgi:hypothetical protein